MDDHSYLERLRELTSEFAQEQNPLKREEILERILFLVATRAGAQEEKHKEKRVQDPLPPSTQME